MFAFVLPTPAGDIVGMQTAGDWAEFFLNDHSDNWSTLCEIIGENFYGWEKSF